MFMQVYNHTSVPLPAATNLTITDTQNNVYTPIVPDADQRIRLPRRPGPGQGRTPAAGVGRRLGRHRGAVLLYKIQVVSLDNRPLELKIVDPNDASQTASAELDV